MYLRLSVLVKVEVFSKYHDSMNWGFEQNTNRHKTCDQIRSVGSLVMVLWLRHYLGAWVKWIWILAL